MSTNDSLRPTSDFEAELRSRLHELADHAPTSVRAIDEVAVRRAERASRSWRTAGIAASVAVLVGAGSLAFVVAGRNDVAGADSPDAAVSEMVAAIENSDVLGAIDLLDPAEVPALRAALDQGRTAAEQVGLISSQMSLDRLQGIGIDVADLSLSAEELAPDLAVVTPVAGSITARFDPQAFPFGSDVAAAIGSETQVAEATAELGSDLDAVRIATVKRDGRWFVSLQYSIAESARQAGDEPFPTEPPVVPVGAATPEEAATAFYTSLVGRDAAALATSFAPGEGDALLRYAPLWVPAMQASFDESAAMGDPTSVMSGLTVAVDGGGERRTVEATGYTLDGTIDPAIISSFGPLFEPSWPTLVDITSYTAFSDAEPEVSYVWLPAGTPVPATVAELAGYDVLTQYPDDLISASGGNYNMSFNMGDGALYQQPVAPEAGAVTAEPYRAEFADGCLTVTGKTMADYSSISYEPTAEQVGDESWRVCDRSSFGGFGGLIALGLGLSAFEDLPPLEVVEVDGAWYVSPIGTVADGIIDIFEPSVGSGGLWSSPIAGAIYGIDRRSLEQMTSGSLLAEVPEACRALLVADAAGVVTGVVDSPEPLAARACSDVIYGFVSGVMDEVTATNEYLESPETTAPAETVPIDVPIMPTSVPADAPVPETTTVP
jgi:hypothetical protein